MEEPIDLSDNAAVIIIIIISCRHYWTDMQAMVDIVFQCYIIFGKVPTSSSTLGMPIHKDTFVSISISSRVTNNNTSTTIVHFLQHRKTSPACLLRFILFDFLAPVACCLLPVAAVSTNNSRKPITALLVVLVAAPVSHQSAGSRVSRARDAEEKRSDQYLGAEGVIN